MDFILNILEQGLSFVIPMIVLLGVLIFIHELGHFLVAKYFNVKVEVFSLGFGPKLWKRTYGETTYCISAIPFGGYVKMFGDEMGGDVTPEMRDRAFLHKPIPQRIWIALAGPLMNLFLTFVIFVTIGLIGERVIAPKLGDVSPNTKAYEYGFRSGDKILAIDGVSVGRWDDIEALISDNLEKNLEFKILRETQEEPQIISATPKGGSSANPLKMGEIVGTIKGFDFLSNSSLVGVADPQSIFGRLGFKTGDQILTINNIEVKTFRYLLEIISTEASKGVINFKVDRYGIAENVKPESLSIDWDTTKIPLPDNPEELGISTPETFVGAVSDKSPAKGAGILAGDKIASINGTATKNFDDIITAISSFKEDQGPLKINLIREGEKVELNLTPNMTELQSPMGLMEKRYTIGIRPLRSTYVENTVWKAASIGAAFAWGAQKTWHWTHATFVSFKLLLQNKVSPKSLGGFIAIGQMAQRSWQIGLDAFLRIMAIISLNLFILNLLPIPILDGGHIVLFTIEAIKGSPLSLRKLEIVQQVGLFLLLFLMAFTIFNDVSRLFGT